MIEFYKDRYCICGCRNRISIKKYHKYAGHRIPRYLNGHANKGKRKLSQSQIDEILFLYPSGMNTCELGKKFSVTHSTISDLLKFYGIFLRTPSEVKQIYDINEQAFDKLTFRNAYWLGFIYADGYICEKSNCLTIKLKSTDRIILEEFKKFLRSSHPIRIAKDKNYRAIRIRIKNKYLMNRLREIGLHQKKSLDLEFPSILPINLYSDFIRGYFDGDGTIYVGKKKPISYEWNITSSKDFVIKAQNILMKYCNLRKTKLRIDPETSISVLRYAGRKQVWRIAEFLLRNGGFYLPRKLEKILNC